MDSVREHVSDLLTEDGADPRWRDHLEDLRYDGEEVRETVTVEDARVVVTSHRVLAFTPNADGPQFRQVDRPNVRGVSTGAESNRSLLARGGRWSLIGLVMIAIGTVVDMDAILGDVDLSGAGGIGAGGVLGAVQQLLDVLRQLDQLLVLLGALVLLAAAVAFGAFVLTRDPRLVIDVAGDDVADITLPRPEDTRGVIDRLERAIFPDGTAGVDGPGGRGGDSEASAGGRDDTASSPPDGDPLREA